MNADLFIGIDGGGTHSTALAAYPDGTIAGEIAGLGLNFHNIGVEAVRVNLNGMTSGLCARFGAVNPAVCAGMAALDGPADADTLALFETGPIKPGQLDLQSDACAALMSHTMGRPGTVVICGTGSMILLADKNGLQHVSGGWGYLLGDDGSGFSLARDALRAAADEADGFGPPTPLAADATAFFGAERPRQLIDIIYAPETTPDRVAGFARSVLTRAAQGEAAASGILAANMERLAVRTASLLGRFPEANLVGLYGGIFGHSALARSLFTDALVRETPGANVSFLHRPPEFGALAYLFLKRNAAALDRLNQSYKEYSHERH